MKILVYKDHVLPVDLQLGDLVLLHDHLVHLLGRLVCWGRDIWLDLWVLSLSLIGNISHIATISID